MSLSTGVPDLVSNSMFYDPFGIVPKLHTTQTIISLSLAHLIANLQLSQARMGICLAHAYSSQNLLTTCLHT